MKCLLIGLMLSSLCTLTACASRPVKDHDSFLYSVPIGSKLVLKKEITIPANLMRRYFQNGKAVLKKDIDIYYPHCSIKMKTLVEHERTINPAVFEIYKIMDDDDYVQRPVYVASRFFGNFNGPTLVGYSSIYYLRSTGNSGVRYLECGLWDDILNVEYLSINEVKKSLGAYFSLEIND